MIFDLNFKDTGDQDIKVQYSKDQYSKDQYPKEQNQSYLEQLEMCIYQVLEEESHLIDTDKIESFLFSSQESKMLFTRLFLRKWKWLRVEKLCYDEMTVEEHLVLIHELKSIGFVETNGPTESSEWLDLLVKDELVQLCLSNGIPMNGKLRQDLIHVLINSDIDFKTGPVVRITETARILIQKVLIIHQRIREWPANDHFMTNSILANLSSDNQNKISFVKVGVVRTGLLWPTREEFELFFNALVLESKVHCLLELVNEEGWFKVIDIVKDLIPKWKECKEHVTGIPWFTMFTCGWIYTRILATGYMAYFRLKRYPDCADLLQSLLSQRIFCNTKRGYWYDELAKITERYIDVKNAKRVCLEALSDPFVVTGHRGSIIKRAMRLYKNKVLPPALYDLEDRNAIPSRTIKGTRIPSTQNRVVMQGEEGNVTVEEFVLEYFAKEGWYGLHTENSVITTLFGILFWDILFDDTIPGVFHSPYQSRPLDIHTEYFYVARQEKINKRLLEIENEEASSIIERVAEQYRPLNTVGMGVNWKRFTNLQMIQIAESIGGKSLKKICECFAKSMWAHLGGVPDLCLWKPNVKEFKLVEVKSENDRLSSKQIEWLDLLKSWGVSVQVVHVTY